MYACTHTHTHIQQLARLFARILCSRIHIYILFRKEVHIEDEDEFVQCEYTISLESKKNEYNNFLFLNK